MVFLCPRANAELVPKFRVALHASHAALPMVTLRISSCSNVTLTFDFGLDHREERKQLSNKEIKIWSWDPLETRHQDELAERPSVAT
jgi:hypothetical protein